MIKHVPVLKLQRSLKPGQVTFTKGRVLLKVDSSGRLLPVPPKLPPAKSKKR